MFTHDGSEGGGRLARKSVKLILCAMARRLGEERYYTGKSLRRGMVTVMAASGLSTEVIMSAGRWRTADMVSRYTAAWTPALAGASTVVDRASSWELPRLVEGDVLSDAERTEVFVLNA